MCDWTGCPCGRELFWFISPGNVSICAQESLKTSICDKIVAFWLSFHSFGFCMCESVLRKTFACLYVYWWVCERKTKGVCSSVCANEPLIFHFCPSVYICLMNQISLLNVSMPEHSYCVSVFIFMFFCIQMCVCACMSGFVFVLRMWACICLGRRGRRKYGGRLRWASLRS